MNRALIWQTRPRRAAWLMAGIVVSFSLGGCASYAPEPLPAAPKLSRVIERPARASAERPLTLEQVATLAVRNNPDLRAKRARRGVAVAKLYGEGLLPDPQLSFILGYPTGSAVGLVNAYDLGLSYDLIPLITRPARVAGAQAGLRQVDLELLWQSWQVSKQARILAVRWAGEVEQLALLQRMNELYRQRYDTSAEALQQGDLTLDVTGTDLTALVDSLSHINQLEQTHNETDHSLRLLLGLTADAPFGFALPPPPASIDAAEQLDLLSAAQQRRPDLLALQAGYRSQEAKVRAAILGQFPSFTIGVTRARDTSNISTTGFSIGLNLPLFSGNRAAIATERATRDQLRAEYQARLDQAVLDSDKLIRLQGLLVGQQERLDAYLPTLARLVEQARAADRQRDLDTLTFLNMESTLIAKQLERIQLEQSLWETHIGLQTLLALPPETRSEEGQS